MLWDLYNHDFDQAGSYFGAKKANEPVHVLYAYDTGSVDVDNLSGRTRVGCRCRPRSTTPPATCSTDAQCGSDHGLATKASAPVCCTRPCRQADDPPAPAKTFFVEFVLSQGGAVIDRNVYWLSTQHDVVDWSKTIGNPQATMTRFADLRALGSLSEGDHSRHGDHDPRRADSDGADTVTDVTITNTSTQPVVGFFLRADVRRGTAWTASPAAGDNEVLPIFWNDNDITLWPGESDTLEASYRRSDLRDASPVVSVAGWNMPAVDVPAG